MNKAYLAKIIAKDSQGLQLISAYCSRAKLKVDEIKFLKKNKILLLSLERFNREKTKIMKKLIVFVSLSLLILLSQKI